MWTHTLKSNSMFGTFSGMSPRRSKKVRMQERQNLNQLFNYPSQLKLMCYGTSVTASHLTSGGVTTGIIFEQPGLKLSGSIWSFEDWVSEQIRKLLKDLPQVAIKSWQRIQLISKVPPKQSLNRKFLFCFSAVFLAIFFGNRQTSNIINQEKFCGSTDEEACESLTHTTVPPWQLSANKDGLIVRGD